LFLEITHSLLRLFFAYYIPGRRMKSSHPLAEKL